MYKISIVIFFYLCGIFLRLNMQDIINEKGHVQIYESKMGHIGGWCKVKHG